MRGSSWTIASLRTTGREKLAMRSGGAESEFHRRVCLS